MKILKNIFLILVIFFGIFVFWFGGYDDSPGAQLLGVLIVASGGYGIYKNKKISNSPSGNKA